MNAGMLNGMMGGGLNPPLMVGGGMGLVGQPQFAQVSTKVYLLLLEYSYMEHMEILFIFFLQLVPGLPAALAVRAPIPNMFPAAINPVSSHVNSTKLTLYCLRLSKFLFFVFLV